jgi:hypothetical protein
VSESFLAGRFMDLETHKNVLKLFWKKRNNGLTVTTFPPIRRI